MALTPWVVSVAVSLVNIAPMNILVTGGLGGVGRPLVEQLLAHEHTVRVFDRVSEQPIEKADCVSGEITDFAALREAMRGMQAVVHLAALTHPAAGAGHDIFHINVTGTFNVYEAAAQAGIRRVVSASSINALGYNFGVHVFPIQAFPLDESHPSHTTDVYSFSKQTVEEIAAYYWRRDGISGVQLRLPFVYSDRSRMGPMLKKFMTTARTAYAEFAQKSEVEQRDLVQRVVAQRNADRAARLSEVPWDQRPQRGPRGSAPDQIDPVMALSFGFTDFWTAISATDAAQAFEKGVTANYEGSHPLYVCEAENSTGMPSATLAKLFYPDSTFIRPITGTESLVSFARARELIGYEPAGYVGHWVKS